jgi:hypothetical protein
MVLVSDTKKLMDCITYFAVFIQGQSNSWMAVSDDLHITASVIQNISDAKLEKPFTHLYLWMYGLYCVDYYLV